MEEKRLSDINLRDMGTNIQIAGIIMKGRGNTFLIPLPDEEFEDMVYLPLTVDEWKVFLRQTDIQEVEVLAEDKGKLKKAILRKSARQVDAAIMWRVFKRDNFLCQYCVRPGRPLTVDHLVLWEEGGPTIEENLITACRRCNKTRGNMPYEEWLKSEKYKRYSLVLPQSIRKKNEELATTLASIPRRYHKISR